MVLSQHCIPLGFRRKAKDLPIAILKHDNIYRDAGRYRHEF